ASLRNSTWVKVQCRFDASRIAGTPMSLSGQSLPIDTPATSDSTRGARSRLMHRGKITLFDHLVGSLVLIEAFVLRRRPLAGRPWRWHQLLEVDVLAHWRPLPPRCCLLGGEALALLRPLAGRTQNGRCRWCQGARRRPAPPGRGPSRSERHRLCRGSESH